MSIRTLDQQPNLPRLFGRAVLTARGRQGGRLPDTTLQRQNIVIDRQHLGGYADVCGFRQSDLLPPTYPHLLGFPLAVTLMVDPTFPFAMPGLVHVNNRIEQKHDLVAGDEYAVKVFARDLRDHPRGRQFDMVTELSSDGETVWSESSTYLHREGARHRTTRSPASGDGGGGQRATAFWRLRADAGRRYAAVSGDINPIHLNPFAARLFGFRRTIAHGMWIKARCLAALEGRLPGALSVQVEFKSPVLLPSTVGYSAEAKDSGWNLGVAQARGDRLHLVGRISARLDD